MSTPAKVAEWLRNNNGNLTDAYKAVGYEGPPLKIKEGNLTNNRSNIRLAIRGENGDSNRRAAERLNPPQTKEEQNRNRRQNYKRSSLRKAGKNVVIDHKQELKLLSQTVDGMTPEQAKAHIKRLEESYGPLGNRPDNRQIVGARYNELKRQGSEKLQQHLGKLNKQPFVGKPNFLFRGGQIRFTGGMMPGVIPYVEPIAQLVNERTDGGIDKAIDMAVEPLRKGVQRLVDGAVGFYVDMKDIGFDLKLQ